MTALAIGLVVLNVFKHLEDLLPQDQRASLTISGDPARLSDDDVRTELSRHGLHVGMPSFRQDGDTRRWTLRCEVRWRSRPKEATLPTFIKELSTRPGIALVDWVPIGKPSGTID